MQNVRIRMVTTAPHAYAGHALAIGEEYDCEPQHVPHMKKLGWSVEKTAAQQAVPQQAAPQNSYTTRDMVATRSTRANSRKAAQ